MGALDRKRLEGLLDEFGRVRLLVVGDLVLDEYVWGDVDRVSPEAPVPVVRVRDETVVLGGAANVARNIVALGAQVSLVSIVGDDTAGDRVRELVTELGVDPASLIPVPGRPTTRKTRVIARTQQVVRFDRENVDVLPAEVGARIVEAVGEALGAADGAVIEDYGKGVLGGRVGRAVMKRLLDADVPAIVDPKSSLAPYKGAAVLKPNLREAEELAGMTISTDGELSRAAHKIRQKIGTGAVVVTRGAAGMALLEGDSPLVAVPTVAREVFDVQGAGDTAIAALSLALRAGASLFEAAVIANAASGVVVAKVGTATTSVDEMRDQLGPAIEAAEGRAKTGGSA